MATISVFKSGKGSSTRNTIPDEHLDFAEYITNIQEGYWYNEVTAYRSNKSEETKRRLTAVTPSGKFKKQGRDGLDQHSGILCMDIDAKDNDGVNMKALLNDEFLLAMHRSTGGEGYAAYYRIEPDRHLDAFYALEKRLADKFHIIVDPACKDVSRLRFVSHDPEAFYTERKVAVFKAYLPKSKATPAPKFYPHGEHDVEHILQQIESKRIDLTASYADWVKIGFAIAAKYQDAGADLFHRVSAISPKYNAEACDRKYRVLCQTRGNTVSFASFMWLAKNAGVEIQTPETKHIVSTAKSHRMRVGTNGGPKDIASATEQAVRILREIDQINIEQVEEIVAHTMQLDGDELKSAATEDSPVKQIKAYLRSYDLRRNAVTRNIEIHGLPINDTDLNNIYVACLENFGKKEVSMQLVNAIVDSDFVPTYNPFLEFFAKNAHRQPTGCIEALTNTITSHTQEHQFIQLCILKWYCSVVASMQGEYSLAILVLCGDQGIGKTNFFRHLLPAELRPYYAESKLDAGKDDEILMCKKIILCDDEFGGKSKQEAKKLKELSSKQTFSIRKPYGRVHEDLNRYAVLCGTSNDEEVINDPTGNRRILPVVIADIDWDAYEAIDKTDLLMEAYHLVQKLGADAWQLNKAEIGILNKHTQLNVQPAVEKELFFKLFRIATDEQDPEGKWLTNSEIKDIIETYSKQKVSAHKLGAILKSLGCKKVCRRERNFLGCYFVVRLFEKSDYAQMPNNKGVPF